MSKEPYYGLLQNLLTGDKLERTEKSKLQKEFIVYCAEFATHLVQKSSEQSEKYVVTVNVKSNDKLRAKMFQTIGILFESYGKEDKKALLIIVNKFAIKRGYVGYLQEKKEVIFKSDFPLDEIIGN